MDFTNKELVWINQMRTFSKDELLSEIKSLEKEVHIQELMVTVIKLFISLKEKDNEIKLLKESLDDIRNTLRNE